MHYICSSSERLFSSSYDEPGNGLDSDDENFWNQNASLAKYSSFLSDSNSKELLEFMNTIDCDQDVQVGFKHVRVLRTKKQELLPRYTTMENGKVDLLNLYHVKARRFNGFNLKVPKDLEEYKAIYKKFVIVSILLQLNLRILAWPNRLIYYYVLILTGQIHRVKLIGVTSLLFQR